MAPSSDVVWAVLASLSLPRVAILPALSAVASILAFLMHVAVSCALEQFHSISHFVALAPVTV